MIKNSSIWIINNEHKANEKNKASTKKQILSRYIENINKNQMKNFELKNTII